MHSNIDPSSTKYLVEAKITIDGVVDKPDVVGAIFGQTEGLLGDDLDLRDLQKSGKVGRIEVEIATKEGKSEGMVYLSSSLDQVESSILAAALETIDRIGPCKASIKVAGIEDVRTAKRERIVERAKELLTDLVERARGTGASLAQSVRSSVQVEEITTYGPERCPAGPNVKDSDAMIIVEGRSDVLNLLRAGIKNAIAVEGTNIPKSVQELSKEKVTTAFVDGDRGGELILRELFQTSEVDFVARAPRAREVEELSAKQLVKCLRNKVPSDQYMEMSMHLEELGDDYDRRDRRGRFNGDAADRFRKHRDHEDDISEQTVDTVQRACFAVSDATETAEGVGRERVLSEEQKKFRDLLHEMIGTHNAVLLDSELGEIKKIEVRKLADYLTENDTPIRAIVSDGVIGQNLIDCASKRGVSILVGKKRGKIIKLPTEISVWTKDDLD